KGYHDTGVNSGGGSWAMSGSTITFANSANDGGGFQDQQRNLAPGANLMWASIYYGMGLFQVTDATQNATTTTISTNSAKSSGFPTTLPLDSSKLYIQAHPMPDFTCTSCTGAAGSVLAAWPAHTPFGSFNVATINGSTGTTPQFLFGAFGD